MLASGGNSGDLRKACLAKVALDNFFDVNKSNEEHGESHDMEQYVWTGGDRYILKYYKRLVKSLLYCIQNSRKM